jgi:hypothetical protein
MSWYRRGPHVSVGQGGYRNTVAALMYLLDKVSTVTCHGTVAALKYLLDKVSPVTCHGTVAALMYLLDKVSTVTYVMVPYRRGPHVSVGQGGYRYRMSWYRCGLHVSVGQGGYRSNVYHGTVVDSRIRIRCIFDPWIWEGVKKNKDPDSRLTTQMIFPRT